MPGAHPELVGPQLGGKADCREHNSQASMATAGKGIFGATQSPFASAWPPAQTFNMDTPNERRVALVCHNWGHSSTFFTWNFTKQYLLRVSIYGGALASCKGTG
jgi:hypothetical protein